MIATSAKPRVEITGHGVMVKRYGDLFIHPTGEKNGSTPARVVSLLESGRWAELFKLARRSRKIEFGLTSVDGLAISINYGGVLLGIVRVPASQTYRVNGEVRQAFDAVGIEMT